MLLIEAPPSLLVTEVRLGAYNGLQLAYLSKSARPQMPIVLTSAYIDVVLQRDMERMGVTFVPKPITAREFVVAVYRTALRQPNSAGVLEPVQLPFERRQGARRQPFPGGPLESDRRRSERRRSLPFS